MHSKVEQIVYVVDDDVDVREGVSALLQSVGLKVVALSSTVEFLTHKRSEEPSCLILDVRLPGLSGLDFQAELAKAQNEIPIIFITGHGDIPMSVKAMKAGAIEFLPSRFGSRISWMRCALHWNVIVHATSSRYRRSRCGPGTIRSAIESGRS